MRARMLVFAGLCISLFVLSDASAQPGSGKGRNKDIAADRKAIAGQRDEMKGNAADARAEEESLKQQIQDAMAAGDREKAKDLRDQLRSLREEHAHELKRAKGELSEAQGELKKDRNKDRGERARGEDR